MGLSVKTFNNISEIVEEIKKKTTDIEANYIEKFNNAKKRFMDYSIDYLNCDLNKLVCIEPLFTNQKENITKYLKSNTLLSEKQICNRIKNIYNILIINLHHISYCFTLQFCGDHIGEIVIIFMTRNITLFRP